MLQLLVRATSCPSEVTRSSGSDELCASPGEDINNAQQCSLAGSTPVKLISPHLRQVPAELAP